MRQLLNDSEASVYRHSHNPLLVVLSGPSGVGKDSVLVSLKEKEYPLHFVVTATTRAKRASEVDGRDYHFVSLKKFNEMIKQGELLEHALVYGQYKGIPKQQVRDALAEGKDVIMRIDVQGAATVRGIVPEAVMIFLIAGSEEELFERLRARKTESPEELATRMATAREEYKRAQEFDYVVVNRDNRLHEAVDDVINIIRTEHLNVRQRRVNL